LPLLPPTLRRCICTLCLGPWWVLCGFLKPLLLLLLLLLALHLLLLLPPPLQALLQRPRYPLLLLGLRCWAALLSPQAWRLPDGSPVGGGAAAALLLPLLLFPLGLLLHPLLLPSGIRALAALAALCFHAVLLLRPLWLWLLKLLLRWPQVVPKQVLPRSWGVKQVLLLLPLLLFTLLSPLPLLLFPPLLLPLLLLVPPLLLLPMVTLLLPLLLLVLLLLLLPLMLMVLQHARPQTLPPVLQALLQ